MIRKSVLAATVAAFVVLPAAGWAKTDKQFIEDAIKGDNSEVTLGNLAATRGDSARVRSFGETLAKDHAKAKVDAVEVAKQLGVSPPDSLTEEAQKELKKLEGLSGAAFDKEFASYMTDDHKKDIAEFEEQASTSKGETSALAKKTLPTLEKHLKIAESLTSAT